MDLKCKNLMLGNWVKTDITEPQRVAAVTGENQVMLAYNDVYSDSEIEPVPLTDDFFERNGWKRNGAKYTHPDITGEIICWGNGKYIAGFQGNQSPHKYLCSFEIHFVHQLQQIFSLCGIEVELDVFANNK